MVFYWKITTVFTECNLKLFGISAFRSAVLLDWIFYHGVISLFVPGVCWLLEVEIYRSLFLIQWIWSEAWKDFFKVPRWFLVFFTCLVVVFVLDLYQKYIAASHGSPSFGYLRNLDTVFHSGGTNLYSHQQCTRSPPFSTFVPTSVICVLFEAGHSERCEEISHCGLTWISLIISDVEHLLMCLLAISISSLAIFIIRYQSSCLLTTKIDLG